MSDMPQQQNSAAYAQVLQPGASAPLTENEANHYHEAGLPKLPTPVQSQISPSILTTSPNQQNLEIYQDILRQDVPTPTPSQGTIETNSNNPTAAFT